ncbi:cell wall-binding repeat-containing protein [Herbiconiux liangxiaofengii]|uniref:cell wall-binding repeat-containing protein n=1 Tax=Herbiconiux liangxiaofengii TaxID=3342795 RepID=UPI0035B7C810
MVRRSISSWPLRSLAAIVLLAAVAGGATAPAAAAGAVPSGEAAPPAEPAARKPLPRPERLGGADRYEQSVMVSKTMQLRHVDIVYIASGEKFPDALSAASVAGLHRSPLLLTARDTLPESVRREVLRLTPTTIVIVGGEASVSEAVALQLSQTVSGVTITRVGGADRYEVSRNLIRDPLVGSRTTALFIATGSQFTDALSAAPAARQVQASVLLIDGGESAPTMAERMVFDELTVDYAYIAGGPASVSSALERSLQVTMTTERLAGPDRFAASVAIANRAFARAEVAYLASGVNFPDALSGGPVAAYNEAPLYLVRPDCVPEVVLNDLARLNPKSIVMLGGPATLGEGVQNLTLCA